MNISEKDKKRMIDFYNESIRKSTFDWNKVGWNSKENQEKRFEILTSEFDLNGNKILDYGCGIGDLYGYLSNRIIDLRYCGFDINEKMIDIAVNKYGDHGFYNYEFEYEIVEENFIQPKYTICSGVFSFKINDYKNVYKNLIKNLYS